LDTWHLQENGAQDKKVRKPLFMLDVENDGYSDVTMADTRGDFTLVEPQNLFEYDKG